MCSTLDIFNKFFSNSHQNQTSISNTLKIKYGSWGNKDEFHRSCSTLKLSIRYKIMSCLWLVSINKTVAIVYVILPYFKSNTLSVKATFHLTFSKNVHRFLKSFVKPYSLEKRDRISNKFFFPTK